MHLLVALIIADNGEDMALLKETTIDSGGNTTALTINGNLYFKNLGGKTGQDFKICSSSPISPNVEYGASSSRNEIFSNATTIKFGSTTSNTVTNLNISQADGDSFSFLATDNSKSQIDDTGNYKKYSSLTFRLEDSFGIQTDYADISTIATDSNGRVEMVFSTKYSGLLLEMFKIRPDEVYFNYDAKFAKDLEFKSTTSSKIYRIGSKYDILNYGSSTPYQDYNLSTKIIGSLILAKDSYNYKIIPRTLGVFNPSCVISVRGTTRSRIRFYKENRASRWEILYTAAAAAGAPAQSLRFIRNGSTKGYIHPDVAANFLFTGQHRNIPIEGNDFYSDKVGLIVVSDGTYQNMEGSNIQINESLPKIKLANQREQQNVFGVVSDKEDLNSTERVYQIGTFGTVYEKQPTEEDTRVIINSIGEGGIWVTNVNGNFENGDYITTCEIPGYGMKQDSEFLHNYTVAKITCDCDFDVNSPIYMCEEFQWENQTFRRAFVGCTYHCG